MARRRSNLLGKIVGTAAVLAALSALQVGRGQAAGGDQAPTPEEGELNAEERKILLQLARDTITTYLRERRIPHFETRDPKLLRPGGAFVTLRRHGDLRGCIGYLWAEDPIYETVQRMAVAAATQDPRFRSLRPEEVKDLTIEISLLSQMEKTNNPESVEVGRHGLLIRRGYYQGLLLPQVAPEQGWNRQEFLEGVCYKAGLPSNAWCDPETELCTFTAEVFSEEE